MCNAVLEHPKEIVKIYNNLHDNEVKIFMAAPYYDPSIIADYNYALDESVKDIKASNPHINLINVSIRPSPIAMASRDEVTTHPDHLE